MDFEIFFDPNGSILLELHQLEFSGDGQIHDPKTGKNEKVEFSGPLSVAKIEMMAGEGQTEDGQRIPSFDIVSVDYEAQPSEVVVSTFGDLPLYKSHKFEDALKMTLVKQNEEVKKDLLKAFQEAENHMWRRFPWNEEIIPIVFMETNMKDKIQMEEENISITLRSEVKGISEDVFETPLRTITPKLDENSEKDVQIVFDENLVNHVFAFLFNTNQIWGARRFFLEKVAEALGDFKAVINLIEPLFVQFFVSKALPELHNIAGKDVYNVDFRCDFLKDHLEQHLSNVKANEIRFKPGNRIEYDFSSICGIFANTEPPKKKMDWKPFKSIAFRVQGHYELDIKAYDSLHKFGIKPKEADVNIVELKVFDDGKIIEDDSNYRDIIEMVVGMKLFEKMMD
jgi:hypothetical protein